MLNRRRATRPTSRLSAGARFDGLDASRQRSLVHIRISINAPDNFLKSRLMPAKSSGEMPLGGFVRIGKLPTRQSCWRECDTNGACVSSMPQLVPRSAAFSVKIDRLTIRTQNGNTRRLQLR